MAVSRDVLDPLIAICTGIATPRSLTVLLLVDYGEWDQLSELRVDPANYNTAESYFADACVTELLRKLEDLPTSFDRKKVAEENFLLAEKQCYASNLRLHEFLEPRLRDSKELVIYNIMLDMKKFVGQVLGSCPEDVDGRFGPGATFGDLGKLCTVPDKMTSRPTLTESAKYYLLPWSGTRWSMASRLRLATDSGSPLFVQGNRFTTVPKDCSKHRGIAIEPGINLFYQLAYGSVLKRRLGKAGLDLANGQSIHKQVAREASLQGHLCTIDLSNASDTVCRNLVKFLLPASWFQVLDDLRSHKTLFRGNWHLLEKFSSMGNGFTFELETLIFLAIAHKATELAGFTPTIGKNVLVYGDDIIVPTGAYTLVKSMLSFLGFTLNGRKSFHSGQFRESCGGDYFNGVDVRPHYLKDSPCEPQQHIAFANGLRRMAYPDSSDSLRWLYLKRAWFLVLDKIPASVRSCRGPKGLGDIVIWDRADKWRVRSRNNGQLRYVQVYRPAHFKWTGWEHWHTEIVFAAALYGSGDGLRGVLPRDAPFGYKVGWSALLELN